MTPLNTIGCIALGISALCAVAAFARGEWDIKRANNALNQPFGDLPNLDGDVLNSLHKKAE
jgi:hypothetical protein